MRFVRDLQIHRFDLGGVLNRRRYVVLVRHAQSQSNEALITCADGLFYSNSGCDPTVPLTALGEQQAVEVGRRIASLFPARRRLRYLYLNEFLRVQATASAIQEALPYRVSRVYDSRLNKRNYGLFWNLTRRGVELLYPGEWHRYLREGELLYRPPEGGENYFDHFARVDTFIDDRLSSSSRGNVLIVTHALTVLAFRRRFEGLSEEEVVRLYEESAVPNTGLFVYRQERDGSWTPCEESTIASFPNFIFPKSLLRLLLAG